MKERGRLQIELSAGVLSLAPPFVGATFERVRQKTRVSIGHALVDDCSAESACAAILEHARGRGKPAYVITPNAQHIVLLERDPAFRQVYRDADLVLADGASLLLAAKLYGRVLSERVSGVDIFVQLSKLAAENGLTVFLLGGRPGSADLAAALLRQQFPGFQCSTYCPPQGFEKSAHELSVVAAAITAARPHLLFAGLGAPKQEYWIRDHGLQLGVPVSLGIGGSFEMVAGVVGRAPKWMQQMACEWLYRLVSEPRRLWRRYLIGNYQFAHIVMKQRARRALLAKCMRLAGEGKFAA